jgi:hypothetical protein
MTESTLIPVRTCRCTSEKLIIIPVDTPDMDTIMLDSATRDELNELMGRFGYDSLDLLLTDMVNFVENRIDEFAAEYVAGPVIAEETAEEL